jgi:Glycine rich protein
VSEVQIVAIGAPGAVGLNSSRDSRAGRGAQVSGDVAVTPGQTLYVNVGGAPTFSNTPTRSCVQQDHTFIACAGGFNGGGSSQWGGGGGGASDVRTLSRSGDQLASLHSRLIVAAGGGGSGGGCDLNSRYSGGAGGDATEGGDLGQTCVPVGATPPANAFGGSGGSGAFYGPAFGLPPGCCEGIGGPGSLGRGENGSLGQGGNGGGSPSQFLQFGGGGGGGLFGGGGGGYGGDPRYTPYGTGEVGAAAPTWCRPAARPLSLTAALR